jgi:hypothetical protein
MNMSKQTNRLGVKILVLFDGAAEGWGIVALVLIVLAVLWRF